MPILEIEMIGAPAEDIRHELAQRIADAAGGVLRSDPQETWVRLRILPADQYAENGGTAEGLAPVFVSVLRRRNPEGDDLSREVEELTSAIATACGRPKENVHVRYESPGADRQAFGGRLI
jgi:phenylpyruvate tautomerase PptA (4-oxalocrotonate tautomerase family)